MTGKSKRLSLLSDAEHDALYGLPDFDHAQQLEYLLLSETELALARSRSGPQAQIHCALQIGYFKAKHAFFRFTWSEAKNDVAFVLNRYFDNESAIENVERQRNGDPHEHNWNLLNLSAEEIRNP